MKPGAVEYDGVLTIWSRRSVLNYIDFISILEHMNMAVADFSTYNLHSVKFTN
jgi:hypothetical protein